jgi:DNA-binding PadR family transcriptional regulator
MIKNHLKLIVLKKLEEKSLSGYGLIKEIYESTGSWKPSFGSMYPLLKELNSNNLVTFKIINRKKVYSITALGKKTLKETLVASQHMVETMGKEFKMMENICNVNEKKQLNSIIHNIHHDTAVFGGATDEIDKLQRIIMDLLSHGKFKSKEQNIKKILNSTITQLKKL